MSADGGMNMDRAVANALKRKEELEKELAEIQQFLKLHDKFAGIEPEQKKAPELPASSAGNGKLPEIAGESHGSVILRPRGRGVSREDMGAAIDMVFEEVGKPLTRSPLVEELEKRGIPVSGADKSRTIGTTLWRLRHKFINLGSGFGYWPKDKPYEPAGYVPD